MIIGLTDEERAGFAGDGFLVRRQVLSPSEVADQIEVVEAVVERVSRRARREGAGPQHRMADGHRIQFSSRTAIQWEWATGGAGGPAQGASCGHGQHGAAGGDRRPPARDASGRHRGVGR